MKKLFCFIAFALAMLVSVSAQAQMKIQSYTGGTISIQSEFTNQTQSNYSYYTPTQFGVFTLGVDAGCFFTDKFAVGFNAEFQIPMSEYSQGKMTLSPYFRYRYLHKNNLSLMVDTYFEYGRTPSGDGLSTYGSIGGGIRPSIGYSFDEHWMLCFSTGKFGYTYRFNSTHYVIGKFNLMNPELCIYYTL